MNIKTEKKQWMQEVADGDPTQALEDMLKLLTTWVDGTNRAEAKDYLTQCAMLSGRWKDLQKEVNLGIIGTADEKLEGNKIAHALLQLLDALPDELDMKRETVIPGVGSTAGKKWWLILVGGTILIGVLWIFSRLKGEDGTTYVDPPVVPSTQVDSLPDAAADSISEKEKMVSERKEVDLWKLKYTLPEALPIDWNLADEMCATTYGCLPAQFLPIGWSVDERFFAYINLPAKEAVEGVTLTIRIQNMETNTTEWEYTYGAGESSRRNEFKTVPAIWDGFYELFTGKLRKHGIIPGAGRMMVFPGKIDGKEVIINLDKEMRTDGLGRKMIFKESITAALAGKDPEVIYTHEYERYGPLNTIVMGALIAPSGSKLALIKVNERPGFEGPPNPLSPTVIGWGVKE